MDNHELSNSSESHSNQNIPSKQEVPDQIDSKADIIKKSQSNADSSSSSTGAQDPLSVPRGEKVVVGGGGGSSVGGDSMTHSELMLEPKAEYIDDDMNEDSVEDLTLDDDDVNNMESLDHSKPGPSHGSADGQGEHNNSF